MFDLLFQNLILWRKIFGQNTIFIVYWSFVGSPKHDQYGLTRQNFCETAESVEKQYPMP